MSALDESHRYCRAQTRAHARSFFFASIALPKEKKRAAYAVYAFCRYADDLVDRAGAPEEVGPTLARVAADFERFAAGQDAGQPFAPAFAWAVRRYEIPREYFLELLTGVASDLGRVRMADWEELRLYSYRVASVVGLMMARIFELREAAGFEHAVNLGLAMQLTNILRDVGEDYRADRIYLPADEMQRAGVPAADLGAPHTSDALKGLLRTQAQRARDYYRRAEPGIALLPDDGSQFTVWLMRHVYAGILDEIERAGYEVLRRRARTSFGRKLLLAARAWRDYRRHRSRQRA